MEPLLALVQVLPDLGDLFLLIPKTIIAAVIGEVTLAMDLSVVALAFLTLVATVVNVILSRGMLKEARESIRKMEETINLTLPNLEVSGKLVKDAFDFQVKNLSTTPVYVSGVAIDFRSDSPYKSVNQSLDHIKTPLGRGQRRDYRIGVSDIKRSKSVWTVTDKGFEVAAAVKSVLVYDNAGVAIGTMPEPSLNLLKQWIMENIPDTEPIQ